ncbi:MAG: branched-chain amino acid ABC transporter permease [Chloroflexi bacterium]|nr:branched-chain amino acid ABC transporter permease [Chloroflexota bacterium]
MSSLRQRLRLPQLEDRRLGYALVVLLLAAVVLVPARLDNNYYITLLTSICVYTMLGLGLNIVVGYAGLLDLGYAAFFAIGAYATAYYMTTNNLSYWIMIPIAAALAAVFGVVIGAPTLRLRSDYLAIVTLGFGEITRISATNLDFTGGPNGLYGVPQPSIFGFTFQTPLHFFYLSLALALVTLFCVARLGNSRIGRAWAYIREDELAAAAMGINPVRIKLLAYALGAVWGGVAGSFLAVQLTAVSPESFTFNQSVTILIVVVLGGLASVPGVIVGAVVVVLAPELWRNIPPDIAQHLPGDYTQYRLLVFALALIVLMIFRPEGLWPSRQRKREMHAEDVALVGPREAEAAAGAEVLHEV